MATIATFSGGTYNPSYVSSGITNGILIETWNRFTVERDNSNTSGSITWRDIGGSEPWKFAISQSSSQPSSIQSGNGDPIDITSKDGWYLHSFNSTNNYYGYTIISISSTNTEGTGTGENAVSGTIVDNSTHYTFTVSSTAPSSSGVVAYNVLKDDVLYAVITHTNGATNPMNVYLSSRSSSVWKLTIVSSTGLYNSGVLATLNSLPKKVFCNFW